MSASSLQPMRDVCFYVSGHVTVHPDAAIAPNVLLQADPGSQLVIHAGVSLGSGTILHASGGVLEISENATVGNQVLMVGCGSIGASACIGAFSTLMMAFQVSARQVLPPSSLIGDTSRQVAIHPDAESPADSASSKEQASGHQNGSTSPYDSANRDKFMSEEAGDRPSDTYADIPAETTEHKSSNNEAIAPDSPNPAPQQNGKGKTTVYGRAAVEQMIRVMFPARQYQLGTGNGSLNSSASVTDQSQPSDSPRSDTGSETSDS